MVGQFTALIIIIALIVLAILGGIGWFVYMKIRYKTVPSNTALIITGPKLGDPEKESNIFQDDEGRYMKVIRGGVSQKYINDINKLSVKRLSFICPEVLGGMRLFSFV